MRGHIADDQWIDVVEGVADREVRAHLDECAACRATVDDVRAAWAEADMAEVPEPSPLYWDSFRKRVGEAIAQEAAPRAGWRLSTMWLAAAASVVVAVSSWNVLAPTTSMMSPSPAMVEAWAPLPPADEDEALPVLAAASLSASEELAAPAACDDVTTCLMELTDEESEGLMQAVREEMGERTL